MNRKVLIRVAVYVSAILCAALSATPALAQKSGREISRREVVVTFDDLPFVFYAPITDERRRELTTKLLRAVVNSRVPAIGFVNERQLYAGDVRSDLRIDVLKLWTNADLELGNHTYSHPDLHATPPAEFEQNVVRGETVTRELLRARGSRLRYFRHPFLHTGRDLKTKRNFESFLARRGYTVAPVTIDNSDYIFAKAYALALARGDRDLAERIAAAYLPYMEECLAYYEDQSRALLGREIPQVLLLHANELNADTFALLAAMMRRRGYDFVTLDRALADAAYRSPDTYTGAGGISWLHRWALTAGKRGEFFRGEPIVPEFVARSAESTNR